MGYVEPGIPFAAEFPQPPLAFGGGSDNMGIELMQKLLDIVVVASGHVAAHHGFEISPVPVYYIDPNPGQVPAGVHIIRQPATKGMAILENILREEFRGQ